jgi:Tfp pilus assembly protein PilV
MIRVFNKKKLRISGQSLFEVVVAIGVAALILVAAASLSTASVRNTNFSKNNALATKFAQEGGEWIRQQRDAGWENVRSNTNKVCLGTLSWSASCDIDITFSRSLMFDCKIFDPDTGVTTNDGSCGASTNIIDSYVTVSWTDGNGTHEVKNVTSLTRWRYQKDTP